MKQGLEERKRVAYFEYDFAKEGGAVGDITLRGSNLPKGAVVTDGVIDVETAVTGTTSTVALKLVSAEDILAATAEASFSEDALLDVVPDGAVANMVGPLAANKNLVATVAVNPLTAGKFTVALEYYVTR